MVIGPRWLTITGDDGRPRLAHPEDNVRVEVEAGLKRDIPLIPVLVQNAAIPDRSQLPDTLRDLPGKNGLPVRRDPDFDTDMHRLIRQLEQWLGEEQPAQLAGPVTIATQSGLVATGAVITVEERVAAELDAAFAERDWPAVIDKGRYLTRRAPGTVSTDTNLKYGLALLEEGEPAQALPPLNAALAKSPNDLRVLRAAARARQQAGQGADAEPILQDALALVNDRGERLNLLAEYVSLLVGLKRWDDAIKRCAEALRLAPGDPQWQARQLRALREAHRDAEALAVARALTARADATADDWLTRARLAYVVAGNKTTDEVRSAIDSAAKLIPANDTALEQARQDLLPPPPPPPPQRVNLPPDRLPPALANLGFAGYAKQNTQFILPPVCTVAAGPFMLGSDKRHDPQAGDNETPEHQVTLPAYQIGRFPVTVAEYACFVASGHAEPQKGAYGVDWRAQLTRLDHPVTCVTWRDAAAYAAWLASLTEMPWRLPTEAEWEKAARWDPQRSVARLYPWGDQFDKSRCNTKESGKGATTPVYAYVNAGGASPCGALDMAGNVWEWTSSLYKPYPYSQNDGREEENSTENRVLRGGSWLDVARGARAAFRGNFRWVGFLGSYGFRLVLSPVRAGS